MTAETILEAVECADSDSHACAEILLHYFRDGADERDYIRTYRFL